MFSKSSQLLGERLPEPGRFSAHGSLQYLERRAAIVHFDDRIQAMISMAVWNGELKNLNPKYDQKIKLEQEYPLVYFWGQVRKVCGFLHNCFKSEYIVYYCEYNTQSCLNLILKRTLEKNNLKPLPPTEVFHTQSNTGS